LQRLTAQFEYKAGITYDFVNILYILQQRFTINL
jgi:hypothetical protein